MTISPALTPILHCPSSRLPLQQSGEFLTTPNAEHRYPIFCDLPWLLPNPQHSLLDWQIKISGLYDHLSKTATQLMKEAHAAVGSSQKRLHYTDFNYFSKCTKRVFFILFYVFILLNLFC